VVEDIIKKLTLKFEQDSPLTVSRGCTLEYLGMQMDYQKKGVMPFSMKDYLEKMLKETPYDMEGSATTPAAIHLFNTDDSAETLSEDKSQLFHHIVAKLLYLCRRTRQDIQTAVAFVHTS